MPRNKLSDPENPEERYRAPALDRGLDILEVLARQAHGLTRSEIVSELGVSASHIYRMLERLVARGYVTRLAGGDRYMLTMKLYLLGSDHPPVRRLVAAAQPLMDAFAQDHGQSLHLVVPERGTGIIVAQASPVAHWEFRARIGAQLDLFTTGSGLTLLAMQAPNRRAETLGKWGLADGEARLSAIAAELRDVREKGYRVAPSAQVVGITDLSVPLSGPHGDAAAVITCAFIEKPGSGHAEHWEPALAALQDLAGTLSYRTIESSVPFAAE
ncbi:IclR family transcriptional regulator [Fulvimarina sp. MAC8]|uniref:IclR family transcriptional regulator n=1 Tax=Fulvimarina sp. MAC8 TaxID=3162874 RepID=UPI0032ECEE06